jgi:hypothetical protein
VLRTGAIVVASVVLGTGTALGIAACGEDREGDVQFEDGGTTGTGTAGTETVETESRGTETESPQTDSADTETESPQTETAETETTP